MICRDCGVEEGEYHKRGCCLEVCPYCGHQLLCCFCNESMKLSGKNFNRERIPWIYIPNLCSLCGKTDPDLFKVDKEVWKNFVIPSLQKEILCIDCFNRMVALFPYGWKDQYKKKSQSMIIIQDLR
jgi:hypothetical protein